MPRKPINHPPEIVAVALRTFLETDGNIFKSAEIAGVSRAAVRKWADKADWDGLLEAQREEVKAKIAAETLRQIVTIKELRVNIHYRALVFIHQKLQEWDAKDAKDRGQFPFDPLRLADAMAKADQGSPPAPDSVVVKDNFGTVREVEPNAAS